MRSICPVLIWANHSSATASTLVSVGAPDGGLEPASAAATLQRSDERNHNGEPHLRRSRPIVESNIPHALADFEFIIRFHDLDRVGVVRLVDYLTYLFGKRRKVDSRRSSKHQKAPMRPCRPWFPSTLAPKLDGWPYGAADTFETEPGCQCRAGFEPDLHKCNRSSRCDVLGFTKSGP